MHERAMSKLGIWGGISVLALLSCSSRGTLDARVSAGNDEPRGGVQLGLVPVSGVTLNAVHYAVTSSASPSVLIAEGDLPTPGSSSDFSFGLSLPVGSGYRMSVSAASAETGADISCGGSFAPFDVLPNATSSFKIVLSCHDDSNGQLIGLADVKTDACPRLVFDYVAATPSVGEVGKPLTVLSKAHDLDGKPITYTWQTTGPNAATFTSMAGPSATLSCLSSGALLVTATASNGECSKSLSTRISCVNVDGCGNGVIDPGESCDKALGPCPADCHAECGNGVIEPPIEDCDPGNTLTCNALCRTRVPLCGDGWLSASEFCDPSANPPFRPGAPSGVFCSPNCTELIPSGPVCGNGLVQVGEECDDGGASPTCSNTCKKISTAACVACENASCFEDVDDCLGAFSPFDSAGQTQCFNVMACIEKSNCFDGEIALGRCYCGSFTVSQCAAAPFTGPGSPDGACAAEIRAGFPNFTRNTQVLAGLTNVDLPSGAAMRRLSCQKNANSEACRDTCGFSPGGPAFP